MNEQALPILLATVGAASLAAAIAGHRSGHEKRDVRLLALIGGAVTVAAVAMFYLTRI